MTSDSTGAEAFCVRVYPRLVTALRLQSGSTDIAEELAQEVLARAWERWDRVSTMDNPEGWAFVVAFNLETSRLRRLRVERRARRLLRERAYDHRTPDVAAAVTVRQALSRLPQRQRAAVVLRYFADMSVEQTARALRCAEGTVRSLTSQGVAALRTQLTPDVDRTEARDG